MVSTDAFHSAAARPVRPALAVLPIFAASLFLSALLLFAMQPMFTKMVLPLLGGSPSVWSVAMVFFQTVLLAGYLYAHLLVTRVGLRHGALVHIALLVLTVLALPFAIPQWASEPPAQGQPIWLLGLFAAAIGLPFFAVAGNGPLLQAWFARSGHPDARDPYFLYGASNLGSLAALLLYPLVAEPLLTLWEQRSAWTGGFILLAALIIGCAIAVPLSGRRGAVEAAKPEAGPAPTFATRATWVGLSFVPSALLVAVTSHLSTDVAAAPLLWVVPLALFLLTFILAFTDRPRVSPARMLKAQPWFIGVVACLPALGSGSILVSAILIMIGLFLSAMVAHQELYKARPQSGRLTEFYLWISFGGVLGGVFTGLLAPVIFSRVLEYPILVVVTLLCRPDLREMPVRRWLPLAAALVVAALAGAVLLDGPQTGPVASKAFVVLLLVMMAVVMFSGSRPGLLLGGTAALTILVTACSGAGETVRSFFGVHRLMETADGQFRLLAHGTTIHGAQRIRTKDGAPYEGPVVPATYYYKGGSIAQAIDSARAAHGGTLSKVAAVGLGTGSLACSRQPGEDWRFFEIDPAVVRIAKDPARFRFLSDCAPKAPIILGDARLTLAKAQDRFDLIVLDAFSSDAIPVHLLTREAIQSYRDKLAPGGVLLFHISNRHMDLRPFVARTAADLGLVSFAQITPFQPNLEDDMFARSMVIVVVEKPADVGPVAKDDTWSRVEPDPSIRAWTDDYSNILDAIWRKLRS